MILTRLFANTLIPVSGCETALGVQKRRDATIVILLPRLVNLKLFDMHILSVYSPSTNTYCKTYQLILAHNDASIHTYSWDDAETSVARIGVAHITGYILGFKHRSLLTHGM